MEFSVKTTRSLKRLFKPGGYSIIQNGGYFNDIGHYHMHVFPRYKNDGLVGHMRKNMKMKKA